MAQYKLAKNDQADPVVVKTEHTEGSINISLDNIIVAWLGDDGCLWIDDLTDRDRNTLAGKGMQFEGCNIKVKR